ncbi:threonylcarbamoyl-AMP synthase [bacterium]|nr:threonylcarbamoyl-AMP synthase [bacterium]
MLFSVNSDNPEQRKIKQIVDILKDGGVIAYPTDTSYGIGCDLNNKKAVEKVYKILQLPKNKHLSFLCSDLSSIAEYAVVSNFAYKTIRRLIPGAYTFILGASKTVPDAIISKRKEVGIRVPKNNICQAIIEELGGPIINATAKKGNGEFFLDGIEIEEEMGKLLDAIIDAGNIGNQGLSTVIDFSNDEVTLVRKGMGDYSWIIEE